MLFVKKDEPTGIQLPGLKNKYFGCVKNIFVYLVFLWTCSKPRLQKKMESDTAKYLIKRLSVWTPVIYYAYRHVGFHSIGAAIERQMPGLLLRIIMGRLEKQAKNLKHKTIVRKPVKQCIYGNYALNVPEIILQTSLLSTQ